jgi:hypothetical protein
VLFRCGLAIILASLFGIVLAPHLRPLEDVARGPLSGAERMLGEGLAGDAAPCLHQSYTEISPVDSQTGPLAGGGTVTFVR